MAEEGVPEARAVVVWQPREVPAEESQRAAVRQAERDARLASAERRRKQAELEQVKLDLALVQFRKLLALSEHPDFAAAVGPLTVADTLKLAESVAKEYRLDNGQATENVAHAHEVVHTERPSVDFGKLTQEQRNQFRELLEKARAGGEGGEGSEGGE